MTYYASPSGSGIGCSATSPCALQTALNQAMSGDTVMAKDGIYNGGFRIQTRGGTSSAKIIVKAQNKHRAVIRGTDQLDTSNFGFSLSQPYWVVEGFRLISHLEAFTITALGSVEVRHNIISDFHGTGAVLRSNNNAIHHNVIAFAKEPFGYGSFTPAGLELRSGASNNAIHGNIIYSLTNDGYMFVGTKIQGSCAALYSGSQSNKFQGNICLDTLKQGVRVWSGNSSSNTSHNVLQDNIFAFSEGGTGLGDYSSNYNKILNNIFYGIHFSMIGAKGNNPGLNEFRHNLIHPTEVTRSGGGFAYNNNRGQEHGAIVKDNLFYSNVPNNGTSWLWGVQSWPANIKESNYNLFWRPGPESKWTNNVAYGVNDIHSTLQKPVFADEANGDFTLAPRSPGKGSASDGKDPGISFNTFLKKSWMRKIIQLPTQQKNVSGTSVSFPTSAAHQYRVHVYIPESNPYLGAETFTIEGKTLTRDYKRLLNNGGGFSTKAVGPAPQRWVYLGTHPNDGTFNISWQHSNAASKILIRQLPTPEEAYSWIGDN
jgi:hypothetical protein